VAHGENFILKNEIARLDDTVSNTTEKWVSDETMPNSVDWDLAVDNNGNPAYIDYKRVIYWKRNGVTWTKLNGKAARIAFGPHGELFKINFPTYTVAKFNAVDSTWSELYGDIFAQNLEVGADGQLWVANKKGVHKWSAYQNKWISKGLEDAKFVTAGPKGFVYALAAPVINKERTIYRLEDDDKWTKLEGKTAK